MKRRNARSLPAVLFLLLLPSGMLWAGEGKIRRSQGAVKNEYIVVLEDDIPRDRVPGIAQRLAKQHGGELKRVWQFALKGFFIRMTEGQAQGLSHHPDVQSIEENAEVYFSATVPTKVSPACNPAEGGTCPTDDNRLWHLDVLDQNSGVGTNEYSYCETGAGVYVYVIDTGVMRAHQEFGNDANRVVHGYDATGDPDWFGASDPCGGGPALTQVDGDLRPNDVRGNPSHGTGVASLVAGKNVGVARGATIVPVKVMPCGQHGARKFKWDTPNREYATGEVVFASGSINNTYHLVTQGGVTGSTATYPLTGWHQDDTSNPTCCQQWGGVTLQYLGADALPTQATIQMLIEGLDWIVRPSEPDANGNFPAAGPGSPYPKAPAVVTLSTYRIAALDDGVTNVPAGASVSLEGAIGNLLTYNNGHGITVIASANNQDANACDTTPGRMSRNNPNKPPGAPWKVITAGGTMLRNNPDPNPDATGGGIGPEPAFNDTRPTVLARWRCHAGDSDDCSTNIYTNPAPTPDPTDPADRTAYAGWTLGSNGGACVTLFAPAKNIPVANLDGLNTYRNPRAVGAASGTSWSAPIVAGLAARILQSNPTFTVDQVHDALMSRTVADLDTQELNPPGVTGTPRNVLRLTPIVVQPLPALTPVPPSGNASIAVSASGPAGLTYELYEVDGAFDVTQYDRGAQPELKVLGPQSSSTFSVSPTPGVSYFARVISSCGTADTTITTIASIGVPAGVVATATGGTVTISWNATANASGYKVERKTSSSGWTLAQTVTGGSQTSVTDTPSVASGVVLYRVRATQGSAVSDPSNPDIAYAKSFTDDPILTAAPYTTVKAAHVVEIRAAVNALRSLGSQPAIYTTNDLNEALLRSQPIRHTDFTTLLSNLNTARGGVGLPSISFTTTPVLGGPIKHTENVRAGLR